MLPLFFVSMRFDVSISILCRHAVFGQRGQVLCSHWHVITTKLSVEVHNYYIIYKYYWRIMTQQHSLNIY